MAQPPMPKNGTLEETRDAFEHWMAEYPPLPDARFEPFSIGALPACWVFARDVKRQNILLFLHGGGYVMGSVRSHWGLMSRISQATGCAVLGIKYRLAPENPYPAALQDAMTAYLWLLHHPYPHNQIAFVGTSAGAGLALSLMLRLKLEKRPLPAACVLIGPWIDLARSQYPNTGDILNPERIVLAAKSYAGINDLKDPFISPLYGDLRGLPPLLIQTGSKEILHEEALELAKKAKKSGVKVTLENWPDMFHIWHLFSTQFPEGQDAIDAIGQFLKTKFQKN